ncbi:MAG: phage holin family protein [Rubrivivax sp.]
MGEAVQRLLHAAAEVGRSRLELALLELEAERTRLARAAWQAAILLVLVVQALVLLTAAGLLGLPPEDRAARAGALGAAFTAAAAALGWRMRCAGRRRRPWLSLGGVPPRRSPGG